MTTTKRQLEEAKLGDLMPQVMIEVDRVAPNSAIRSW